MDDKWFAMLMLGSLPDNSKPMIMGIKSTRQKKYHMIWSRKNIQEVPGYESTAFLTKHKNSHES